jgi:hypothetical protein
MGDTIMAITINADTSNGLKLTSDTSGQIDFQSAGSTKALIDTSGNLKFNSGFGSAAVAYGCRAWVNFNGTGTVAIRSSGNVSSITDNGTGNYTVNSATDMPDADYSAVYGGSYSSTTIALLVCETTGTSRTVNSLQVRTANSTGASAIDAPSVQVAIFR